MRRLSLLGGYCEAWSYPGRGEAVALPAGALRPPSVTRSISPIGHSRLGAISSSHLGRIGLDLMLRFRAPDDQRSRGTQIVGIRPTTDCQQQMRAGDFGGAVGAIDRWYLDVAHVG